MTKPDCNIGLAEDETHLITCPECRRATDELVKFCVIDVGECCRQPGQSRGIDPGREVVQVFAHPLGRKFRESGEDKASWRKWMPIFKRKLEGCESKAE